MVSNIDCTLEDLPHPPTACLGLRLISGSASETMDRIVSARRAQVFDSAEDLARRAHVEHAEMRLLAAADALTSLSGHRRQRRAGLDPEETYVVQISSPHNCHSLLPMHPTVRCC
jgi:error-prone DNA polymerase